MKVDELFDRCVELAEAQPTAAALRYLHETLVLACAEGLRDTRQGFGNLFAQVDFLCKRHGVAMPERIAVQQARRHSNGHDRVEPADWRYDVRAVVLFIAAVFSASVPQRLLSRLPVRGKSADSYQTVNQRYLRCVVTGWDDQLIYATTDEGAVSVRLTDPVLPSILTEGMQLNLLDCVRDGATIEAGLIVVEPDFLVDISSIAACFQEYGHHPLSYVVNRMKPRPNTQAILLGNFAGSALDDLINQPTFSFADTLYTSFKEQALQFCTCRDFNGQCFKDDAQQQVANIQDAVQVLFDDYDRSHAILEPSFVCERLGVQGRVDLMTDDMRLLVEQKSGKNWLLAHPTAASARLYKEDHYVQLLLYYGVLRYNFQLSADRVDIRLLYSKYPARQGLLVVNFYQQLFREAISLRNRIVAQEIKIAREGFATLLPQLQADLLLENPQKGDFFNRYIRPEVEQVLSALHRLSADERDYAERMLTFIYREQLAQKIGVQEGQGGSVADLWNMPLTMKRQTGNIITGDAIPVDDALRADYFVLRPHGEAVEEGGQCTAAPNFRCGDMVYVYRYAEEPNACANILYKGVIEQMEAHKVVVRLNDRQQNPHILQEGTYAIEHSSSDIGTVSAIRSVLAFCTASPQRRDLLLGHRRPVCDPAVRLSRSYHPHYDDILLKAVQARDYFLLQGPPGTGKTSMALRFLVEEEQGTILLTAYTNRAVDEICGMLEDARIDYLRIGHEASCDERFRHRLLETVIGQRPRLDAMRQQLASTRVVVGTTSTLQARPFLLQVKHFSLCIVDEASQILEPSIIGLLASDSIGRFILVGDHKQLPAVVQQPDSELRLHACRLSLFERLLRQEEAVGCSDFVGVLRRQGRMHPAIAAFPNEMFYSREQLQPAPCPHQLEDTLDYRQPSEDALDDLLKARRVLFLPSDATSTVYFSDQANQSEAHIVADLLRRIYRQYGNRFDAARSVGVIVPYRLQIAMIRAEIEQLHIPALAGVSIDTVERYQGSQRDVIIYSFTVQRPYQLDFLTGNSFEEDGHQIDRKLNVAMTRARRQLLMTGNAEILRQNEIFGQLIRRYSI